MVVGIMTSTVFYSRQWVILEQARLNGSALRHHDPSLDQRGSCYRRQLPREAATLLSRRDETTTRTIDSFDLLERDVVDATDLREISIIRL